MITYIKQDWSIYDFRVLDSPVTLQYPVNSWQCRKFIVTAKILLGFLNTIQSMKDQFDNGCWKSSDSIPRVWTTIMLIGLSVTYIYITYIYIYIYLYIHTWQSYQTNREDPQLLWWSTLVHTKTVHKNGSDDVQSGKCKSQNCAPFPGLTLTPVASCVQLFQPMPFHLINLLIDWLVGSMFDWFVHSLIDG